MKQIKTNEDPIIKFVWTENMMNWQYKQKYYHKKTHYDFLVGLFLF